MILVQLLEVTLKIFPTNCKKTTGFVQTADNKKVEVIGVGTAKFGNMELNDVAYVPSFSKNLVSGIQIMRQGYKQIIENNNLKIYKDDILVATGSYDSETGLLKMDTEIPQSSNFAHSTISADYKTIHSRLGHPGHQLLLNTVSATD